MIITVSLREMYYTLWSEIYAYIEYSLRVVLFSFQQVALNFDSMLQRLKLVALERWTVFLPQPLIIIGTTVAMSESREQQS